VAPIFETANSATPKFLALKGAPLRFSSEVLHLGFTSRCRFIHHNEFLTLAAFGPRTAAHTQNSRSTDNAVMNYKESLVLVMGKLLHHYLTENPPKVTEKTVSLIQA